MTVSEARFVGTPDAESGGCFTPSRMADCCRARSSSGTPKAPSRCDVSLTDTFHATILPVDNGAVVTVRGEIDLATGDRFWAVMEAAFQAHQRVVLDLSGTNFIDSTGLNAFVRIHNDLTRGARDAFVIRSPGDQVRTLLRLTGLDEILTIVDTATDLQDILRSRSEATDDDEQRAVTEETTATLHAIVRQTCETAAKLRADQQARRTELGITRAHMRSLRPS